MAARGGSGRGRLAATRRRRRFRGKPRPACRHSRRAQYPDLVDLYSVGQSFEGREIWQITITNKKTGKDTDKPAFFLEGGRHAGEISGIEASLYFIHHVLSGYGTDPALTALVDTKALYVRPNNNPDGNTLYHLTAQSLAQHGAAVRL